MTRVPLTKGWDGHGRSDGLLLDHQLFDEIRALDARLGSTSHQLHPVVSPQVRHT